MSAHGIKYLNPHNTLWSSEHAHDSNEIAHKSKYHQGTQNNFFSCHSSCSCMLFLLSRNRFCEMVHFLHFFLIENKWVKIMISNLHLKSVHCACVRVPSTWLKVFPVWVRLFTCCLLLLIKWRCSWIFSRTIHFDGEKFQFCFLFRLLQTQR